MKILILSPYPEGLIPELDAHSDDYVVSTDPVTFGFCVDHQFDFLISYGYRYLLSSDILGIFGCKAVNLHISLLPFSRGAHPVFWSIADKKPLGVTIHLLDEGLDTGNILFQQVAPLAIEPCETFLTLYNKQKQAIEFLFRQNWRYLRTGECSGWKQQGLPTCHRSREISRWEACLPQQWNTTIVEFCRLAEIRHPLIACH